jgi:hypothetical protein
MDVDKQNPDKPSNGEASDPIERRSSHPKSEGSAATRYTFFGDDERDGTPAARTLSLDDLKNNHVPLED